MTPWSLTEIDAALRASWSADTCSPDDAAREPWHPGNPAWGHCDLTTLLVHDLFGGELICGDVHAPDGTQHGYHWWNRLPSGIELDLTAEQFRRGQRVTGARTVPRPPGPLRRHEEYVSLRARVATHLGPLPGPEAGQDPTRTDPGRRAR